MKNYMLYGLAELTKHEVGFRIMLHCQMSDDLGLPDFVYEQYADKPIINFVINDTNMLEFSFDDDCIYWDTSFNGIPASLKIRTELVLGFSDDFDLVTLHSSKEGVIPRRAPERKEEPKKPKLTVIHNENFEEKTNGKKPNLRIVE